MNTQMNTQKTQEVHHGSNVKRLRELLDIKQDSLAQELASSQQTISRYEAQEILDDDLLNKIANVLHVSAESIKNFDEEAVKNVIYNTFNSNEDSKMNAINFNLFKKLIQRYEDQINLCERLIRAEKEKNALLEKLLNKQSQ